MSLFQKSVIKKYLKMLNMDIVEEALNIYSNFYGDEERINNIKLLKEENYQEGFLREIFVQVLGYTINPDKDYNLTTEYKNETDAKKADGAILENHKAIGVIELKSTKTRNLETITAQAFNYKNHQHACRYVITSNFEKLRFYLDDATDYEEFDLFKMDLERFSLLFLLLNKDNLFAKIPIKLKSESLLHEEKITKKLYSDYSSFKNKIFNNLVKNNQEIDRLTLFKKSQKLLDRILFVLFSEDSGLLPPNAISKIIEQWKQLKELDEPVSLYSRYVKLFNHLDVGHKYKNYTLPAYNGELFKTDEILDSLVIDDEILYQDSVTLSGYDFSTEVDVNVLGHIFEHSISEIEEITAEFSGKKVESKRKKEGVFYTPKYVTKYIVDNTVGKVCKQKKVELDLFNIDPSIIEDNRTKKGRLTAKAKKTLERLDKYKDFLLSLKIIDPACGSGAFLNQALEYLISEHNWIDEIRKSIEQDFLGLFTIKKSILENNLYGVDLNEEAVEIAKLSLWLRTAEKGRKLSNLSDNIKCGNSIVDDPNVDKNKAFDWENAFRIKVPDGKFDIVIGNPPYIPIENMAASEKDFYKTRYRFLERKYDSSILFILQGLELLKSDGYLSYISSISWQTGENYPKLRNYLFKNADIDTILNLPFDVFKDAYVDTGIYIFSKAKKDTTYRIFEYPKKERISSIENVPFCEIEKSAIASPDYKVILSENINQVISKIDFAKCIKLGDISTSTQGLAGNKYKILEVEEGDNVYPYLVKGQVYRYQFMYDSIKYTDMSQYKSIIPFYINPQRILIRRIINRQNRLMATLCSRSLVVKKDLNPFIIDESFNVHYVLALLNSKLFSYIYLNQSTIAKKDDFRQTTLSELRKLPILKLEPTAQGELASYSKSILDLNVALIEKNNTFFNRLKSNFDVKITRKLESFYSLEFRDVLLELKKQKLKLSLDQQDEWEKYFLKYKNEMTGIKNEINSFDKKIDGYVYHEYGMTDKEIKSIEDTCYD